jgi:ketosteroid isomerase-like protein
MQEAEFREVHDILQLQALKALYCETIDSITRDAAAASVRLRQLFVPDVKADYGMGMSVLEGRDAVADFLLKAIGASNEALWHSIHTPRIEVKGDRAVGRWTILVRMKAKGAAQAAMLFGRYVDEFQRTSTGWKVSFVHFLPEGEVSSL